MVKQFFAGVDAEQFGRDLEDAEATHVFQAFTDLYGDRWWPTETVSTVEGDEGHTLDGDGNVTSTKVQRVAMTDAQFWAQCVAEWTMEATRGWAAKQDKANTPLTYAVDAMITRVKATPVVV